MHFKVDDVRIREIKELAPPSHLLREFPCTEKTEELTRASTAALMASGNAGQASVSPFALQIA